jgi:nucleoside-diphosphate-sugar epimerase
MVSARVQPIAVDDLAQAVVSALASPRAIGEVYHLGGPETLTWPELLVAVRDALPMTDARKKPRPMPGHAGHALAMLAGALGIGRLLPFGPSEPIMAMEDSVCAMDKARADLGIEPRSFRAALAAYAPEL